MTTRVAAIDIGTNTVLLLVAEASGPGGELVAIEERATITRLGEGVDAKRAFAPAALARTTACLDRYAEIVDALGAERVAVVGTSAMRDAGGGDALRAHVASRFGVEPRTVSGEEEARLTFAGALSGLGSGSRPASKAGSDEVLVFDIGGGSTEVVLGERAAREVAFAQSFDVGSVRLTERYVKSDPPSAAERDQIARAAEAAFAGVPTVQDGCEVVGIAGTMTTLAAVALRLETYDGARVHGLRLTRAELERVLDDLASLPLEERRRVPGLEPKRADVIVAGGLIALSLLARVGASSVTISDRGVRWGLAAELARAPA